MHVKILAWKLPVSAITRKSLEVTRKKLYKLKINNIFGLTRELMSQGKQHPQSGDIDTSRKTQPRSIYPEQKNLEP